MISVANKIVAILIFLINIYFVPATFKILQTSGGPMGFGLIVLPFTIFVNLLLIGAFLVFLKRYEKSKTLLFINAVCYMVAILFYFMQHHN